MIKPQGSATPPALTGEDRRRSQRVMIRTAVTLLLPNKTTIAAFTVSVNGHGAMIMSPKPILAETTLELQNTATREVQVCRVVRRPVENTDGYLVPVEFTGSAANFWGISFPALNWRAPED